MKSSTVAARPLAVPVDLLTEQPAGRATIELLHRVTTDSPDGQPWPPPDGGALWVIVRRADGCTLWRAIACQVRSLPRASAILYWQLQRGGLPMATRSERYPRRFVSTDDLKGRPVIVEIEEERLEELT